MSVLHSTRMSEIYDFLSAIVDQGGPEQREWPAVTRSFNHLARSNLSASRIKSVFSKTLTTDCMHGYGFQKPYGYAGDFEMMDRIYTRWTSKNPGLTKWDEYFHAQDAPRAVRRRKRYMIRLLNNLAKPSRVLNLGCGPGRDLYEFFSSKTELELRNIKIDSVDSDQNAVQFASTLNSRFLTHCSFVSQNILRFRTRRKYDLIWVGGVFDYFNDELFGRLLQRFVQWLRPAGRLVVGNFHPSNRSRNYMEILGKWYLNYRTEDHLKAIGARSGIAPSSISTAIDPESTISYLHVRCPE